MRKQLLSLIAFVAATLSIQAQLPDGHDISWFVPGTTTFTLSTAEELAGLSYLSYMGHTFGDNNGNDTTFILGADIDLTPWLEAHGGQTGWKPINKLDGVFDGAGHTIKGLWMNQPLEAIVGLFGLNSGEIKDLTVVIDNSDGKEGVQGSEIVGGLAGVSLGAISGCTVMQKEASGTAVRGTSAYIIRTGGLVGDSQNASFINCMAAVNIASASSFAGIYTGGLVGQISSASTFVNCYATGTVTAEAIGGAVTNFYTGGLAGAVSMDIWGNAPTLTNCYATGAVSATGSGSIATGTGLLVGRNGGTLTNTFYNSEIAPLLSGVGAETAEGCAPLTSARMRTQGSFTGWDFDQTWAIDASGSVAPFNNGFPYLRSQQTQTITLSVSATDPFTYTVNGTTVTDGTNRITVGKGSAFSFTLAPKAGYTAEKAKVSAGSTVLTGINGVYTLNAVDADVVITVTGVETIYQEPPLIYHTLTLTTGEGIVIDKQKNTFEIQSGNPFSFVISLANGFEGQTPTVLVNGTPRGLLALEGRKWRCIVSEIYEDTNVTVTFTTTANLTPNTFQLSSRDGQLFIETAVPATLAVYTLGGQQVVNRRISEGTTAIPLPAGMYIVRPGNQPNASTYGHKARYCQQLHLLLSSIRGSNGTMRRV